MHWTEAWWSPYVGISFLALFWLLAYCLRRRRKLRWAMLVVAAVFGLFPAGTKGPPGTTPLESAFWRGIELQDWPDIVRIVLYGGACGLIAVWLYRSIDAPRPIGYGSRTTPGDCADNKNTIPRDKP